MNATCGWGQGNKEHPCPKHYSRDSCESSENLMDDYCQAALIDASNDIGRDSVVVQLVTMCRSSFFYLWWCTTYVQFQVVVSVTLDVSLAMREGRDF